MERHGLVVIVAIGESVVALGAGLSDLPVDVALVAVAILGLALSACLWWTYFGAEGQRAEEALAAAEPARRSMVAISAYGYAHLALLLGVVAIAAAVGDVARHPSKVLDVGLAVALGGGGAIYLAGHAAFCLWLRIGAAIPRLIAALAAVVTIALGTSVAAVAQLGALVTIFCVLFFVEAPRCGA